MHTGTGRISRALMCPMSLFESNESTGEVSFADILGGRYFWCIEIKLGAGYIEELARNLLKFKERVYTKKCGEPSFLMVLTGANYSYKREDGVYVVSIGTLKN